MNCLTQPEIAQWLADQYVTPDPYDNAESPKHYLQFKIPNRPLTNASFLRQFLQLNNGEILVHVTDWPTYEQSEMAVVDALRRGCDESRRLIDAAGHLIPATETELAIALFGHTGHFEWNAYLYLPNDMATLYNWEGELYDFWSNNEATYHAVARLASNFKLELTNA